MRHLDFLPVLILPNRQNAQDLTAVCRQGERTTASEILRRIGTADELRLMVTSKESGSVAKPRITWQTTPDGSVVVSAAFAFGSDVHGRSVSGALIFDLCGIDDLQVMVPEELQQAQIDHVLSFLHNKKNELRREIRDCRASGGTGGEFGILKKKDLLLL